MIYFIAVTALGLSVLAITLGFTFWPIAIWAVHRRTKDWIGLDHRSVLARVKGARVIEDTWQLESFSGQTIVATYKRFTLSLSFGAEGKVILASVTLAKTLTS